MLSSKPTLAIVSTGHWRVQFLKSLLKGQAEVLLLSHDLADQATGSGVDAILWERRLSGSLPQGIRHERLFLFDYHDEVRRPQMAAAAADLGLVAPRFLLLLAPEDEPDVGPLPAPAPGGIKAAHRGKPRPLRARSQDICFRCGPTFLYLDEDEARVLRKSRFFAVHPKSGRPIYNQRLEWVSVLYENDLVASGDGLVRVDKRELTPKALEEVFRFSLPVFVDPISKKAFARELSNSKIVLSPAGYSRWAYRHFESMFQGALTVATDLSGYRSIPQVPEGTYIGIKDGDLQASDLRSALQDIDSHQNTADAGHDFARSTLRPVSPFRRTSLRQNYTDQARKAMCNAFLSWLDANVHR